MNPSVSTSIFLFHKPYYNLTCIVYLFALLFIVYLSHGDWSLLGESTLPPLHTTNTLSLTQCLMHIRVHKDWMNESRLNSWYSLNIWKEESQLVQANLTRVMERASGLKHLSFPPYCSLLHLLLAKLVYYFLFKLIKFLYRHLYGFTHYVRHYKSMDLVGNES